MWLIGYHVSCASLTKIPEGDWFCPVDTAKAAVLIDIVTSYEEVIAAGSVVGGDLPAGSLLASDPLCEGKESGTFVPQRFVEGMDRGSQRGRGAGVGPRRYRACRRFVGGGKYIVS